VLHYVKNIGLNNVTIRDVEFQKILFPVHEDPTSLMESDQGKLTGSFVLEQNYPNPFNNITKIEFTVPDLSWVVLEIYDIQGKKVMTLFNGSKRAGKHVVNFDGSKLGSGVYIYKLSSGQNTISKKMILMK
jgi:hypothetical protein